MKRKGTVGYDYDCTIVKVWNGFGFWFRLGWVSFGRFLWRLGCLGLDW